MAADIYYFSGTGNSLHVAKELKKRIPEAELIPIVSLLNRDIVKTSTETVGFVFPVHLMMVPKPVRTFLEKLHLHADYIFAVATRGGSKTRAFEDLEKILKKHGKSLDSFFILNMANNDPKFENWHQTTENEMAKLESELQNRLNLIGNVVKNKEKYKEEDTHFKVQIHLFSVLSPILPVLNRFFNVEFYPDSKCSGCGTCEKVCLSGKVKMVDEKAVWQDDVQCYFCNACLNYCPQRAVQIKSKRLLKSYTPENGRYHHPWVTVDDIAGQKRFNL
jgi:ferredoxin